MKNIILTLTMMAGLMTTACNSFLDLEPMSALSPEQYLTTEDNLASYANDLYAIFPGHGENEWGRWSDDNNTDNMAYMAPSDIFAPGYWRVAQTGGSYSFSEIYRCNYFLDFVLPLYDAGEITGVDANIRHYIGEVYFFRAWSYFSRLKALGDFPIVKEPLDDNLEVLTEASKRAPRNEVARFILEDLDNAIAYMSEVPPIGGANRLDKDCARLFKSRVALYEGTWEKYFKGTAFVPNGPDWPGAQKDYNADYQFPSGNIDSEIAFFLKTAMDEAKIVADKYQLTNNTGVFQSSAGSPSNPYFDMFGAVDMSQYPEIMLYKAYNETAGIINNSVRFTAGTNAGYGITKSMVDAFVMVDGKPIYASDDYPGDADLMRVTENRDTRAQIFIKKPGDLNLHSEGYPESYVVEPWPDIINATSSMRYTTGYTIRKGLNFDGQQTITSEIGYIVFRAAEAYLNYIEACYELNGNIDADADRYWRAIRDRAGVNEDYNETIRLTDMETEARTDWGAYSAGKLVDATLFNIRRERRCELMAEGFRGADIRRWRAMDQMINEPYHVLGLNLYDELVSNPDFIAANQPGLVPGENVSPESFSKYMSPYHILENNRAYDGYRWVMAHYLDPIAVQHFLITGGGDADASPLYQNPGWPLVPNQGPIE